MKIATRRLWLTLASLLSICFTLVAGVNQASAHTYLISSTPKAGSVVDTWPAKITLTFSEKLLLPKEKSANTVMIVDSKGQSIDFKSLKVAGSVITFIPTKTPKPGIFRVKWRVVSGDGHPVSSSFTFTLKQAK